MTKSPVTQWMNRFTETALSRINDHIDLKPLVSRLSSAKVWFAMGLVSIALTIGGYWIGDRYGLLFGFLAALSLDSLIFFYDDLRLPVVFPATELEGRDPWGALRITAEAAAKVGMRRPSVHLIETRTPAAFSTGILASRSAVFLSSALLEKLSAEELRALLSYEILRIKSKQTRTATAVAAWAGIIVYLARSLDAAIYLPVVLIRRRRRTPGETPGQIRPMEFLLSPLVALMVRISITRRAILELDQETAKLLASTELWARVLWKLDAYNKALPLDVSLADAPLFTVNPLQRYAWCRYASAQPSIETRIQALTGRFPL